MAKTSQTSGWFKKFAKFGLVAKGTVYLLLGSLAFMAAFELGNADENAGNKGVFDLVIRQPTGTILLAILAAGLLCYSTWRFVQAFKDTEHKGSGAKGYRKRLSYFFSGLAYTGLAFSAAKFLFTQKKNGEDNQQKLAQELLSKPFGQVLAVIAAAIFIGIGLFQLYLALSGKYKKHVKENNLPADAEKVMLGTGRVGYIARGSVWLIIGGLFLKAALSANAKDAGDTNHAFHWLENSDYGSYLLAIMGVGLICYGIFMFVRAKFQPVYIN